MKHRFPVTFGLVIGYVAGSGVVSFLNAITPNDTIFFLAWILLLLAIFIASSIGEDN